MDYLVKGNDIYLKQDDFDLEQTLDCGQAFRWEKDGDKFFGNALDKSLTIYSKNDYFVFENTKEKDFIDFWVNYFDLETDYGELKELFSCDKTLSKACEFAWGIRILKQDSFEALCSFIISQNNNIPRIKGIISRMCELFGHFPTPQQLSEADENILSPLRAGFRSKYLIDCGKKVFSGEVKLEEIKTSEIIDSRKNLMKIKGVGPKVAECALLYGMYRTEAFPVDVWIKRVLSEYYPEGFPQELYKYQGIAQQYLFHYIRKGL